MEVLRDSQEQSQDIMSQGQFLRLDIASDSELDCGRISFSCDFVRCENEAVSLEPYCSGSPDFEFIKPTSPDLLTTSLCTLIPAEVLFHEGKLLPFQAISNEAKSNGLITENLDQAVTVLSTNTVEEGFHACNLLPLSRTSHPCSLPDELSPPMSPKALTCSAKLGQLLNCQKGQIQKIPCCSRRDKLKPPWKLSRFFFKSRSVGSTDEMDKLCQSDSLPMSDENCNSLLSRCTSINSSSLNTINDDGKDDHKNMDDSVAQSLVPPRRLHSISQDLADLELRSALKINGSFDVQARSTKSFVDKVLSTTKTVESITTKSTNRASRGSSFSEYSTRSHSYSGRCQEQGKYTRQMDFLRLPDKTTSFSSSVRVTPVLNFPVCRRHPLRAVKLAKGRLENICNFLFGRKDTAKEPSIAVIDSLDRSIR